MGSLAAFFDCQDVHVSILGQQKVFYAMYVVGMLSPPEHGHLEVVGHPSL